MPTEAKRETVAELREAISQTRTYVVSEYISHPIPFSTYAAIAIASIAIELAAQTRSGACVLRARR